MTVIRSRENSLVKELVKLAASAREQRTRGATILEGDHLIRAYGEAGLGPLELLVASESGMQHAAVAALLQTAPARHRAVVADRLLANVSQVVAPSGILAVIATPAPPDLPTAIADGLFLEGLQDPGNMGSVLRSALAAGMHHVFLSAGSVSAWAPKVVRAGMGAHFGLTIYENVGLQQVRARASGALAATQAGAPQSIYATDLRGPVVWLVGNEGAGLSTEALQAADQRVSIPMPGQAESLNVAVATALCLFEQVRQRGMWAAPGDAC